MAQMGVRTQPWLAGHGGTLFDPWMAMWGMMYDGEYIHPTGTSTQPGSL